jgi:hypothetical protein
VYYFIPNVKDDVASQLRILSWILSKSTNFVSSDSDDVTRFGKAKLAAPDDDDMVASAIRFFLNPITEPSLVDLIDLTLAMITIT